jgi:hypothetical protein
MSLLAISLITSLCLTSSYKEQPVDSITETRYDSMDQINTLRNKAAVRNALMQVLTQFTLEDLTNANIMVDYRKADKSIEYIHVRLRDASLIPIGYYDDNDNFISILKKKDNI